MARPVVDTVRPECEGPCMHSTDVADGRSDPTAAGTGLRHPAARPIHPPPPVRGATS